MQDEISRYNQTRWNALASADALFTRPALFLTPEEAQLRIDSDGLLGNLEGKNVLLLAGGGGQQSAAFALLGAHVTVFDLSEKQLEREKRVTEHYGVSIHTVQGDMRDLSSLPKMYFDVVYQPYSLSFVPDAEVVFAEVKQILRSGGIYHFVIVNPFTAGLTPNDWNGDGYSLKLPYRNGAAFVLPEADWVFQEGAKPEVLPPPSVEYRQTLASLLNGLLKLGFLPFHVSDTKDLFPDETAEPGTWDHFIAFAPPWLGFWLYAPQGTPT